MRARICRVLTAQHLHPFCSCLLLQRSSARETRTNKGQSLPSFPGCEPEKQPDSCPAQRPGVPLLGIRMRDAAGRERGRVRALPSSRGDGGAGLVPPPPHRPPAGAADVSAPSLPARLPPSPAPADMAAASPPDPRLLLALLLLLPPPPGPRCASASAAAPDLGRRFAERKRCADLECSSEWGRRARPRRAGSGRRCLPEALPKALSFRRLWHGKWGESGNRERDAHARRPSLLGQVFRSPQLRVWSVPPLQSPVVINPLSGCSLG